MLFLLLLLLITWRFQDLGLKAVHHDEAINGWFVAKIFDEGWYNYDPTNYHGPLLFYIFQLGEVLNGWGIETLRGVTVAFSAAWLIYLWRYWKRYQWTSIWFLLVVAVSPGFLFYSRSAIHELPFLFFVTMALGGLIEVFHYQQSRGWKFLIWGLAGAILLKETWVILALAMVIAVLLTAGFSPTSWLRRGLRSPRSELSLQKLRWRSTWPDYGGLHLALAATVVVLLYTGFGFHGSGLLDLGRTYLPWLKTGVHAGGHEKPVYYWLQLLWLYEKPLLFLFSGLLVSLWFSFRRLSLMARWLTATVLLNVLIYSLIPYKTPWCMVSVWGPLIFAYGLLRTEIRKLRFVNTAQAVFTIAAAVALVDQWEAGRQLNFVNPTDTNHKYVYVQTDSRLKILVDHLSKAAEKNPELYAQHIHLAGNEAWPLSWWMLRFGQTLRPFQQGVVTDAIMVVIEQKDRAAAKLLYSPQEFEFFEFPIREGREDSLFIVKRELTAGLKLERAKSLFPPVIEGER